MWDSINYERYKVMRLDNAKIDARYGVFDLPDWRDDLIIKSLRKYGEWAEEEIKVISQFILPGSTIIDAGAFIGTHARAFSYHVGHEGIVYAFEPQRNVFSYLEKNCGNAEIKNIFCFNYALGAFNGLAKIGNISDKNRGATSLILEGMSIHSSENSDFANVKCLDNFNVERIDFIKADIEGMEFDLLMGAKIKIEKHRPVIFTEVNSLNNSCHLFFWAQENNYNMYGLLSKAFNENNFYGEKDNIFGSGRECGLFFIPTEKMNNHKDIITNYNLPAIKAIDDLVILLLHKPQYPHEVLKKSDVSRVLGLDYPSPGQEKRLSEMKIHLDSRERRLVELEGVVARSEAEVSTLQGQVTERERDLTSMRTSRSWRWTHPFRVFKSLSAQIFRKKNHDEKTDDGMELDNIPHVFFGIDSVIVAEGIIGIAGWVFDAESCIESVSLEISDSDGNVYVSELVYGVSSSDVYSNYSYTDFSKSCRFYGKISAPDKINLKKNWTLNVYFADSHKNYSVNFPPLPSYERAIKNVARHDDLHAAIAMLNDKDISIYIDHDMGGGANQYRSRDVNQKKETGNSILILKFRIDTGYCINIEVPEQKRHEFLIKNLDDFFYILEFAAPKEIIINNLVSYFNPMSFVLKIAKYKKNNPRVIIRIMVHDYFALCPSWRLENWEGNFCGIPSIQDCKICMKKTKNDFLSLAPRISPEKWRCAWDNVLSVSDEIRLFSRSSANLFLKIYPQFADRIQIVPHNVPRAERLFPGHGGSNRLGRWTVASVGRISPHKGSEMLIQMQEIIRRNGLPIDFLVIGEFEDPRFSGKIKQTGAYNHDDLPELLSNFEVSGVVLPFRWPETFSYVTHEICAIGVPLVVPDIGAPAEKVSTYEKGLVTGYNAKDMLDGITKILKKYANYPW